jgi:hypothetical protein
MAIVYRSRSGRLRSRSRLGNGLDCAQRPSFGRFQEAIMNEEALNVSVRKFLKKVGITSQREIERAVRAAIDSGRLKGNETLPAKVTLNIGGLDLAVDIEGAVELE